MLLIGSLVTKLLKIIVVLLLTCFVFQSISHKILEEGNSGDRGDGTVTPYNFLHTILIYILHLYIFNVKNNYFFPCTFITTEPCYKVVFSLS